MTLAYLFAFATLLAPGARAAEKAHHEQASAARAASTTQRLVLETPAKAHSHDRTDHPLQQARIIENAGAAIPLELGFRDHVGRSIRLGQLFADDLPVILVLAYYRCRTLCPLVLDGTARAVRESSLRLGVDYRVVTLSIDHRDGPRDAREMRGHILERIGTSDSAADWTFLVGDESAIRSLADALGFGFAYDPANDQFAHPAVAFVLTPGARISAYLYGLEYEAEEVERMLQAAATGRVYGGAIQRVLLRCFHYIPALRRHAGLVAGLLRTGALITVLLLGGWIAHLVWRGRTQEASR